MSAHEIGKNGLSVFLYFYTAEVCFREKRIFYPEEEVRIQISKNRTKTADDLNFVVKHLATGWQIEGKEISQEGYFFTENKAKEQILLIISEEKKKVDVCGKIVFGKESSVTVGTDFHSDIFYEYATFVRQEAFCLHREKDNYVLEVALTDKEQKMSELYVNGKAVAGKVFLQKGDKIEMFGLSLLVLPDLLLCTSSFGILRIAERKIPMMLEKRQFARTLSTKANQVEEIIIEDSRLHEGELEIETPWAKSREQSQPLLLSLGPSVTMILPVLLMSYLGGAMASGASYYHMTVVMTAASAFLSVFWGIINYYYKKHISKTEEKQRRKVYREYLKDTEKYLKECFEDNRKMMLEQYPHYGCFLGKNGKTSKIFWNKGNDNENLGFVRLGIGDVPFQIRLKFPKNSRDLSQDLLLKEACDMAENYSSLKKVPVGICMDNTKNIGFTGVGVYAVVLQSLVQLAALHSNDRMKIIYFYHEEYREEKEIANCLKWLPHTWNKERKVRFLAGNEKETGEILQTITREIEDSGEFTDKCFYVFLIANQELIKGEGLYRLLMEKQTGQAFCMIYVAAEREKIPGDCTCLVFKETGEIWHYLQGNLEKQKVKLEECSVKQAEEYMRRLAGIGKRGLTEKGICENVSFLDLYGCRKIEELNCPIKWQENQTKDRIRVPIGKGEGESITFLDIHEKFHGPHGLVAGTTGAGKSELLQTYLLSLAVSFSPEDINFFIIDYKGGGMGDALSKLPHCSGVISNLSGRQIKRALLSIKSENIRRQRMLSEAKVSHISEYTGLYKEGKVKEPMTHLLLVVDEFAELKKEEPEFMQEIISVSQVGRSLGVHLILATQKPAGTVDDKIWSNTRFRLCLRVAEKQDSVDMLHRPEAANLTGAGRGYLQVGNNELFVQFQTGYSKEVYQERAPIGERTVLVSNTGQRLKLETQTDKRMSTQLSSTIEYICKTADKLEYKPARALWMPELADKLFLKDEWKVKKDNVCLGVYDDPEQQRQGKLYYQPFSDGNLCLCGGPATGKSTFLQTFLWQICTSNSPYEVQFLLAASDCAGINCFEQMPHCLGNMKTAKAAECFFYHLQSFFRKRKELLGGISFAQYQKRQSKKLPILFFVIDNYGSFRQMTGDGYEAFIEKIAGEGLNYGIYLVITAMGTGAGEVPGKLFEKIKTTLALEMSDRVLYGDVLRRYQIGILPKENCKGRGLCKAENRILEFQVPLMSGGDDYERMEQIERESRLLAAKGNGPEKFPFIPEKANYEILWEQFVREKKAGECPLGYDRKTGKIKTISKEDFPFVITGGARSGKRSLLWQMLLGYSRQGIETALYDPKREMRGRKSTEIKVLIAKEELKRWYEESVSGETVRQAFLGICNLADFPEEIFDFEKLPLLAVITRTGEEMQIIGKRVYEQLVKKQSGICLGGNAGNQRMLSFEDLNYEQMSRGKPPGYAYLKLGAGTMTEHIRTVDNKKEDEE